MKQNNRERGVALLLALGFSALLLVMVMAFATNALLENKVANANSSREKGRITGEVALSRALAAIRFYESAMQDRGLYDQGLFRFDNIVSRSDDSAYDASNKFFVGLKDSLPSLSLKDEKGNSHTFQTLRLNGDIVYYYPDSALETELDPNASRPVELQQMQWQYVYDKPPTEESSTERIIGRFAYSVLPDMGTLHKSLFRSYALESPRRGATPNEFPFAAVFDEWLDNGSGGSLSGACGKLTTAFNTDEKYQKAYQIRPVLKELSWSDRKKSDTPRRLYNLIDFSHYPIDNDNTVFQTPYYVSRRDYNQTFFDWSDASTREKSLLLLSDIAGKTVADLQTALPFLKKIKPTTNTFSSEDDWRNQVAANIIDYCDEDNIPTIPSLTSDGMPTYTGNEKTPYIESIGIAVNTQWVGTKSTISGETPMYKWSTVSALVSSFAVYGRVIDYFSTSGTYTLSLSGQVTVHCDYQFADGTAGSLEKTDFPIEADVPLNNTTKSGYISGILEKTLSGTASLGSIITPAEAETLPSFTATVTFKNLKINKAILKKDGVNVDYAKTPTTTFEDSISIGSYTNAFSDVYGSAYAICDAKDPRQNLNEGDWEFGSGDHAADASLINTAAAAGNFQSRANHWSNDADNATTKPLDDQKAAGDPLTTAPYYIRNGTMKTAAEFSLIHRGEAYQTLNLTKAAKPESADSSVSYTDGDAGLLDQIRLGDLSQTAKIDINTRDEMMWQLIFQGIDYSPIKLDSTGELDTTNAVQLTAANAAKLATAMRKTLRENAIFFKSPSQILATITTASAGEKNNETTVLAQAVADAELSLDAAQQETLAAKVIPLLKASRFPDTFKILILAQSIQDVGGDGQDISITRVKNDGNTTPPHNCRLGRFDFDYNSGDIVYFDRITSNVRMIATVKRTEDNTGKSTFTVENIEYLMEGQ